MKTKEIKKYSSSYSDSSFWDKITEFATTIGKTVVEQALILYYVLTDEDVPLAVKAEIVGALGYLILPVDLIPDCIPVAGYTDDASVIAMVYNDVKCYASGRIKAKARKAVADLF